MIAALAERFAPLAQRLAADEQTIVTELAAVQGAPVDLGGYYQPDRRARRRRDAPERDVQRRARDALSRPVAHTTL